MLTSLGRLDLEAGRLAAARRRYQEAVDLFRATGDGVALYIALTQLGDLELIQADTRGPGPALTHLEEASSLLRAAPNAVFALTLSSLAEARAAAGDPAGAAAAATEALGLLAYAPTGEGRDQMQRILTRIADKRPLRDAKRPLRDKA
jgi:hypothetical protein